jgi:hypothetical protein
LETAEHFHEPLVQERGRQKDKHPLGSTGEVESLQNQPSLDRLTQANLIGEQDPWDHSGRDLGSYRNLVRNEIHSGAGKSTDRTLAQGTTATQTFHAKIKLSQLIDLPDKQTLFGFGKTDEIGELSFGNWTTRALVGQQPVDLSNRKHALALPLVRLDCIAFLESHSPNGSAPQSVLAMLARRRKVNLGPAVFTF